MRIYTTLNRIRQAEPCSEGWTKLLAFLNKTQADDESLDLLTIIESNGVDDCLWAFQCTDDNESIYRHMAADFAESVLHIYEAECPNDNRPRLAIQAARDFADGKIDDAAWAAASDAASDAAARAAARAAAWAAASDAASDAAWAAARADARAAAWADAWAAARAAAWAAAWAAASDAAWAAARDAARAAARAAARDAASDAASDAARAAELEKQKAIIIKYLS